MLVAQVQSIPTSAACRGYKKLPFKSKKKAKKIAKVPKSPKKSQSSPKIPQFWVLAENLPPFFRKRTLQWERPAPSVAGTFPGEICVFFSERWEQNGGILEYNFYLSIYLSVCLSICLSVYLSNLILSIYLYIYNLFLYSMTYS